MPSRRVCPGCGSVVEVPSIIPADRVGCYNIDDHAKDGPLVMWPEAADAE